jgi:hypothetical protein
LLPNVGVLIFLADSWWWVVTIEQNFTKGPRSRFYLFISRLWIIWVSRSDLILRRTVHDSFFLSRQCYYSSFFRLARSTRSRRKSCTARKYITVPNESSSKSKLENTSWYQTSHLNNARLWNWEQKLLF